MKTQKLGHTGITVPAICLGTMTWGQQNTEKEAHEQLDYAITERGLNFLDTAEVYPIPPEKSTQGLTETYIGNWLEKRGKRDDLIIGTKVCVAEQLLQTRDTSDVRYDKRNITDAIEGSLQRLKTDYIDLYQIHWPERSANFFGIRGYSHNKNEQATAIGETLETLDELIQSGKVRAIGVSNETPWGIMQYINESRTKNLAKIASIQNQYSLTNRQYEVGMAEFSMRENIPLLAYSTLGMGVLTGKYLGGQRPEGARFTLNKRSSERYNPESAQTAIEKYVAIAQKYNLDPATLALAFAHSREFVASVIIAATNLDQLKTNIDSGDVILSQEILDEIETVHNQHPNSTC